jgi:hypothetical protein
MILIWTYNFDKSNGILSVSHIIIIHYDNNTSTIYMIWLLWIVLYNLKFIFYDYRMKHGALNIQWFIILNNSFNRTKGPLVI